MTSFDTVFCNIHPGTNQCEICCEPAYFNINIPQKQHPTKPSMELFECGHGVCSNCYEKMCEKKQFSCPFCRKTGVLTPDFNYAVALSLQARGYNVSIGSPAKIINTWNEFLEEHNYNFDLLEKRNNKFMQLYRQILNTYNETKRKQAILKQKKLKIEKQKEEKQARELSRKNACCPHCGKNTFNSEKQLQIHIKAKH